MYVRVHGDLLNAPRLFLHGVQLQIKLKIPRPTFTYSLLRGLLHVFGCHVACETCETIAYHPARSYKVLGKGKRPIRHDKVALKTFTFGACSKSVSIDIAVFRNTDFTRSPDTNAYYFRNFGLKHFVMYVNERQVYSEGLTLNTNSAD